MHNSASASILTITTFGTIGSSNSIGSAVAQIYLMMAGMSHHKARELMPATH
jgi:hypothetical protein